MTASRLAALVGLVIGLSALLLQFYLTITARLANGDSALGAIVFYFTFFTILTNLMLVLIYLSELADWRWLGWWRSPVTRAMMAAAITLVMGFYHFVLAATWNPAGLFLLCDIALHYVTPIFYLIWWSAFARRGQTRLRDIPVMLVPLVAYVVYAMARGAIVGEYPYPVLEANRLGYGPVLLNIASLVVVVTVLCAVAIALDRVLPANGARSP